MVYDLIIIGAGAAGLFSGASLSKPVNGLILEKSSAPGKKLLMSGGGQCNLTHGGSVKEFISHYGGKGNLIRSILYQFNNQAVMEFFQKRGVPLFLREDGKVFPESLKARDILESLMKSCLENGLQFQLNSPVTGISSDADASEGILIYSVRCGDAVYRAKKLIIATGGCSYPTTGSDGGFFSILENLGISITPTKPALVPIYVQEYPYKEIPGIAFSNATLFIYNTKKIAETSDALLLTHDGFSGPAILNLARDARTGNEVVINYFPSKSPETIRKELTQAIQGNPKQILNVLHEYLRVDSPSSQTEIPKRFLEVLCNRAHLDPTQKSSQLSGAALKSIVRLLTADRHSISGLGGYNTAMVTAGGISLDEVNMKTLECKKFPSIYFAGEVLDVDGDTGGYNLQFAFSSGYLVAQQNSNKEQEGCLDNSLA